MEKSAVHAQVQGGRRTGFGLPLAQPGQQPEPLGIPAGPRPRGFLARLPPLVRRQPTAVAA